MTSNELRNKIEELKELEALVREAEAEIETLKDELKEEMKKPTITKEGLVLWLKHIQSMSLETKEHKQRLIDIFVNAVYLYDDKLVITFNYKEASKTVTLKEVNGSIIECSGAPIKDGYFDRVTVLILLAQKYSIFCVFLTFEKNIKNHSAEYTPIWVERRIF